MSSFAYGFLGGIVGALLVVACVGIVVSFYVRGLKAKLAPMAALLQPRTMPTTVAPKVVPIPVEVAHADLEAAGLVSEDK